MAESPGLGCGEDHAEFIVDDRVCVVDITSHETPIRSCNCTLCSHEYVVEASFVVDSVKSDLVMSSQDVPLLHGGILQLSSFEHALSIRVECYTPGKLVLTL